MLESHIALKESLVDSFLNDPDFITKSLYHTIIDQDRELLLSKAITHPSASLVCSVSEQTSWLKIWSAALDHGTKGTRTIQILIKILAHPTFEGLYCPKCRKPLSSSLMVPYQSCHPITINNVILSTDDLLNLLTAIEDNLFNLKFA
jgi:hypothetical protein